MFTDGTFHQRYDLLAPSNEKIKFNEYFVLPTRAHHGHPCFLCSVDLYVTIDSLDIMLSIIFPQKFDFSSKWSICRT